MTITRLQRTAAAAAALAFPASMAFFAPQAQAEAPAEPFGPACASVPKEGAGSLEGMAKDPVATAASNNPELSTLASAIQKAGLVDTLNNAENITVFAPTNAAFEKIPQADLNALLNDKEELTKVLTSRRGPPAPRCAGGSSPTARARRRRCPPAGRRTGCR
ncbi:fasciclin domain-containing protein, partial [Streptomyces cyaneofuscatus]|uniref:fasciclin domain-containing protein n=1 Tax=Streptomyces cyaneofuscatus TaxID=66883 RepID=UPI0033BB0C62